MEIQSGFRLLCEQTIALTKKNFIKSMRSKRSTFIQLFSSLFFMMTLFSIEKIHEYREGLTTVVPENRTPEPLVNPPIPPCEDKFYVNTPCYDFIWSGNTSWKVQKIVENIMKNNPGREIPPEKVKSFENTTHADEWLYDNEMRCPGALHFFEDDTMKINYGVQTNTSTELKVQNKFEEPTFKFEVPLQIAAEREIARFLLGDPNFSWTTSLTKFPHPRIGSEEFLEEDETTKRRREVAVNLVGSTFFFASAMFRFVLQISSLVVEKEHKLRQAMSIMGLYDTAYWCSWLIWEITMNLISSFFLVSFGVIFQLHFFLQNGFSVLFMLFFLFQFNMSGFAFLLSTFQDKSDTSASLGFAIFILGYLSMGVSRDVYDDAIHKELRNIWSLFPPNLFAQGVRVLLDAARSDGISWSKRAKCYGLPQEDELPGYTSGSPLELTDQCIMTVNGVYIWLASTFFLWFILAIYFDNVFPNSAGVRKSWFYFLKPGYWTENGEYEDNEHDSCCSFSHPPLDHASPDDKDVVEEERKVKQQAKEGIVDPDVAVQIQGLTKTYPASRHLRCHRYCGCCFCLKCKRVPEYHACKGIWMNFPKNQCMCLLGPNGAGKTTMINCLTGIVPVTSGDAMIYGHSVRSMRGMTKIRRIIGVCPQFDVLWEELSGLENLQIFASIKGLPRDSIGTVCKSLLAEVGLTDQEATMRVSSYSGGMKRRISIAIALIGDPQLVILDEPTTGMDPITRRSVWDVIQKAKEGRAIVLTTHSMEEADALSDRIGIMVKGRLRCIGPSAKLKSKFGTGYISTVTFSENIDQNISTPTKTQRNSVKAIFKKHLNVLVKEEKRLFQTYVIAIEKEKLLRDLFAELETRKQELGISDIQAKRTTLEEVFLHIIKKAELELANFEGQTATVNYKPGTSLMVPIGTKYVAIPNTETREHPRGVMVEIYWNQDDTGALYNNGHSTDIPIPEHAKLRAQPLPITRKVGRSRKGPSYGILVDIN